MMNLIKSLFMGFLKKLINFFNSQGNNITDKIEIIYAYKYFDDVLKSIKIYRLANHPFIRIATEIDGKITCENGFNSK